MSKSFIQHIKLNLTIAQLRAYKQRSVYQIARQILPCVYQDIPNDEYRYKRGIVIQNGTCHVYMNGTRSELQSDFHQLVIAVLRLDPDLHYVRPSLLTLDQRSQMNELIDFKASNLDAYSDVFGKLPWYVSTYSAICMGLDQVAHMAGYEFPIPLSIDCKITPAVITQLNKWLGTISYIASCDQIIHDDLVTLMKSHPFALMLSQILTENIAEVKQELQSTLRLIVHKQKIQQPQGKDMPLLESFNWSKIRQTK